MHDDRLADAGSEVPPGVEETVGNPRSHTRAPHGAGILVAVMVALLFWAGLALAIAAAIHH